MLVPEWYTENELGNWIPFPQEFKEKWHTLDFQYFSQRSKTSIKIKNYSVHSVAFDNPAAGYDNFLRWDCINGFNN